MQAQPSIIDRQCYADSAIPRVEFSPAVLTVAGVVIALSCSREFGIPKIAELPQVTADRVGIVLLCALMAAEIVVHRMQDWDLRFTELGLGVVGVFAAISGIVYGGFLAGYAGGGPDVLLKFLIIPAILFAAVIRADLSRPSLVTFLIIMLAFGTYLGGTAVAERLGYTWALFPSQIGDPQIEQHWGRARGPFMQAEFNGAVMAMLVPLALLFFSMKAGRLRWIGFFVALLLCVGCYLTYTRAVLASLAVILLIGSVIASPARKSYRTLLLMMCLGAGVVATTRNPLADRLKEAEPLNSRLQLLASTLRMIAAHPVAGVGFVNFDHVQKEYYDPSALGDLGEIDSSEFWEGGTHNSLLTPVAELGALVGGIYLLLVGRVFFLGFRCLRSKRPRTHDQTALVTCAILVGIVFVINASLVELRYTLTPNAMFWVGAAFIERASRHQFHNAWRVR